VVVVVARGVAVTLMMAAVGSGSSEGSGGEKGKQGRC
jgi:hypothetical protein